jgi:hypothetical protein
MSAVAMTTAMKTGLNDMLRQSHHSCAASIGYR